MWNGWIGTCPVCALIRTWPVDLTLPELFPSDLATHVTGTDSGAAQADILCLVHHAHATAAKFLKDAVVQNRNPEELARPCLSFTSHLRRQLHPGLFCHT